MFCRLLMPYSIIMLILILLMELLAFIGSMTGTRDDDPEEISKITKYYKL